MSSKNTNYPLRIPKELKQKMKYVAEYNGRSLNKEIEQIMKKYIHDFENKNGIIDLKE